MSANKHNIIRIKHLLAMLKENRYPNFPRFVAEMKKLDIAGAYKMSQRTLLRDIAFLKAEYKAPIEYDYARKGYYLAVPGWSVDIPILEDHEMRAAVIGARLAENIMPSPVRQDVRSAVDSLLSVNENGMDENTVLLSLVAMGSKVSVDPEVFRPVFDAWQSHRRLRLCYHSVQGHAAEYVLEPHALVFYEGNWYLKVAALEKNGVPVPPERKNATFALHRIHSAAILKKSFIPDQKIIDAVNQRKIFDFKNTVKDIRLRLGKEAYRFVVEQFDIIDEGQEGDFHIVRIPEAAEYRIVNYILVEGGDAKLLNHPEIAEEVIRRAKQTIAALESE